MRDGSRCGRVTPCLVRDWRDDSYIGQAVEDQLHGDRRDQEPEDLLGDQHAAFVQLVADPVRPAEHHHVDEQDEHEDAEFDGEDAAGRPPRLAREPRVRRVAR